MRYHTSPTCEHCVSYDGNKNYCKERSSDYFGGALVPFTSLATSIYPLFKRLHQLERRNGTK